MIPFLLIYMAISLVIVVTAWVVFCRPRSRVSRQGRERRSSDLLDEDVELGLLPLPQSYDISNDILSSSSDLLTRESMTRAGIPPGTPVRDTRHACGSKEPLWCDPDFRFGPSTVFINGQTPLRIRSRTARLSSSMSLHNLVSRQHPGGGKKGNSSSMRSTPSTKGPVSTTQTQPTLYGSVGVPDARAVRQGSLGNCWLVSTLILLARHRSNTIDSLFLDTNFRRGKFTIRLFIHGAWRHIVVDSYFPVDATGKLVTMEPSAQFGVWHMLIEKAMAKHYGSWEALEGGHVSEALEDLTGGWSLSRRLSLNFTPRQCYDTLQQYILDTPLLGVGERPPGRHAFAVMGLQGRTDVPTFPRDDDDDDDDGTTSSSSSSSSGGGVITLCNPTRRWKRLLADVRDEIHNNEQDIEQGIIHVSLRDFIRLFGQLYVCYDITHTMYTSVDFTPKVPLYGDNRIVSYRMTMDTPGAVFLYIRQPEQAGRKFENLSVLSLQVLDGSTRLLASRCIQQRSAALFIDLAARTNNNNNNNNNNNSDDDDDDNDDDDTLDRHTSGEEYTIHVSAAHHHQGGTHEGGHERNHAKVLDMLFHAHARRELGLRITPV